MMHRKTLSYTVNKTSCDRHDNHTESSIVGSQKCATKCNLCDVKVCKDSRIPYGKQQPIPAKGSCYLFTVAGSKSIVIVESPLAKLAGWLMHE